MGPIERLSKAWELGAASKGLSVGQPASGYGIPWWLNRAGYMRQTVEVGDGSSSSIVVACLRVLADAFTEAPLEVYADTPEGTPEPIQPHPASALIDRPNPYMTSDLLWSHYIWSSRVDGNCYFYKERSAAGRVVELWPLRSDLVTPKTESGSTNLIDFYEYNPGGGNPKVRLEPVVDVVHLRHGLDPRDFRIGLAPLKVVLREILGDEKAGQFGSALLSNMAIPGVILSPGPGELGPTEADSERIRARWRERFGGDQRGEPLVMSAPMDVKVVAFSPKDLDLKALRRVPEERVAAVLGVPAILAGLGAGLESSSGRSESVTLVEMFTERTVVPDWSRVARQLTSQLLPDFDTDLNRWLEFDLSNVRALQEDQDNIWRRVDQAVRSGWLTVAEAKRAVGYDPDPADDVYLRSMSIEPVPFGEVEQPTPQPEQLLRWNEGGNGYMILTEDQLKEAAPSVSLTGTPLE